MERLELNAMKFANHVHHKDGRHDGKYPRIAYAALVAWRDALLRKLLSGELRVPAK